MNCLAETLPGSALASTLAAFGLILLLTRLRVPLAVGAAAGAVALAVLFGLRPGSVAALCLAGAVAPQTVGLACVVLLMLALSETMRRAGQLDRIVALARAFLRRPAVAMAALPALIGLMPMPGGAHLSAPMVASAAGTVPVSRERLSAVNYWFRHIWEHWWPLYPGVIVATGIVGGGPAEFTLYQAPLGVLMAAAGLLVFRGAGAALRTAAPPAPPGSAWKLLRETSTIWVIVPTWAAARALLSRLAGPTEPGSWAGAAAQYAPLAAGLVVSLAWTARLNRLGPGSILAALRRGSIWRLALVVVGVMVFWHAVRGVGAAGRIAAELREMRVPPAVVVAGLPWVAGMVTGLAVGFVGTSFPIVLEVVRTSGDGDALRAYVALAYGFGHIGQMLSPLHICQVLSNEYFGAAGGKVYRRMLPSVAAMAAGTVGYFLLLKHLAD